MPLVALECPEGYTVWTQGSPGPAPVLHPSVEAVCTDGKPGRCPKGTRKAPDGVCRRVSSSAATKKKTQQTKDSKQTRRSGRRKRCPKGSRRNKSSGRCENKDGIQINTTTHPVVEAVLQGATVARAPTRKTRRSPPRSFSPAVNKALVSMRESAVPTAQLGCGLEALLDGKARLPKASDKIVVVGREGRSRKPVCAAPDSKEAQKVLLRNLQGSSKIDCAKVTAPIQKEANCWFNCMFMSFFVSNKGRKFFRFFRQLMIEGRRADGTRLSRSLRYAFLLFNACISAACGEAKESYVPGAVTALALDTNHVLERVHRAIPSGLRYGNIPARSQYGNPLSYYSTIMTYLGDGRLSLIRVKNSSAIKALMANFRRSPPPINTYWPKPNQGTGVFDDWQNPPDVIVIVRNLSESTQEYVPVSSSFRVRSAEYEIDSAVVRDEGKNHFCALITCGTKELAFDGAAHTRLTPFKWKGLLNKSTRWWFSGDGLTHKVSTSRLRWSFTKSYQELLYYRVK